MSGKANDTIKLRTVEAFKGVPSLHPLVVGHMCKQDKNGLTFSKRYFSLYKGGLLVYYSHEKEFESDVKKHQGIPLHGTLLKLDGVYLTKPSTPPHGVKYYFTLHTPEESNHRHEFLLVCQSKKDMRIWMEQLQAQNPQLMTEKSRPHKTAPYITRMRLQQNSTNPCDEPLKKWPSISQLDSDWLKGNYTGCPGEIALAFHVPSSNPNTTELQLPD